MISRILTVKIARVLAVCLAIIPLNGTIPQSVRRFAGAIPVAPDAQTSILRDRLRHGAALYQAGRYVEAAQQFESVQKSARAAHDIRLAARALGNAGGVQFALHQYQPALNSFREARELALSSRDRNEVAIMDANIASVYTEMGDVDQAAYWLQGAIGSVSGNRQAEHLAEIELDLAIVRARQDRMPEALALFRQVAAAADRAGNWNLYALAWHRLGGEYLRRHELEKAEPPLLEAYRIRKLFHLGLDSSYRSLGRLRFEQGDLPSASTLLDRAVELSADPRNLAPSWEIYHYRGRTRLAQHRVAEALDDLRIATRLAYAWRRSMLPDETSKLTADWLEPVYSARIEAGNELFRETGEPALIRESFEAAEENRASSLRARMEASGKIRETLPPSYWEAVLRSQRAEVRALREKSPAAQEAVREIRMDLARMDAAHGASAAPSADGLLRRAQSALGKNDALLSFHLAASHSWLWAVDRQAVVLYRLPGKASLEAQIWEVSREIREDGPGARVAGGGLYETLFGALAPRFQRKTRWLLALDDALFEAPFAALPEGYGPSAPYLVETKVIEVIPGAGHWVDDVESSGAAPEAGRRVLVAVGDPIYNTADPRLSPDTQPRKASPLDLFASPSLTLARLVGSAAEIQACAKAWNGEHVLLSGPDASRRNVALQLQRDPAVIHFATHFLDSAGPDASELIALSLDSLGENEVLQAFEIARMHMNSGIVTLSGCHSAAGRILPGTGLLGLTRAWLSAGASAVIGSRWAVPDETGALFSALYKHLGSQGGIGAASALRKAQIEMLRSGTWRARPAYWGAYFVMGKE